VRCAEGAPTESGGKPHGLWSEIVGYFQVMDSFNREDRRLMVFAAGLGIFVPLPGIKSEQPSGHAAAAVRTSGHEAAAVRTRLDSRVMLVSQPKPLALLPSKEDWIAKMTTQHHVSLYFAVKQKNLLLDSRTGQ
jgi:hypothetical protein